MKPDDVERQLRNIGERIARAGQEAGFTRQEMGEFAGVDECVLRSWEETRSRPSLCQLKEMAAHCGTPPDWLLGRDLIDEVFMEQSRHSYVCLGGVPLEDLPLVDLDAIREFILWVWQQRRPERNANGVPFLPAETSAGREAGATPRQHPGPAAK